MEVRIIVKTCQNLLDNLKSSYLEKFQDDRQKIEIWQISENEMKLIPLEVK